MDILIAIIFALIVLAGISCYLYIAWKILSDMGVGKCVGCPLQEECYRAVLMGCPKLCDTAQPLEK